MKREFDDKCYDIVKRIPRGKVSTYANVARALGIRYYRAVGQAMKRSPGMPAVPCHRVVKSDGTIGGFNGGIINKINMLKKEGIKIEGGKIVDFENVLYAE